MSNLYTTGKCFLQKPIGAPDAYRVAIYSGNTIIAYASGGDGADARKNADLIFNALTAGKGVNPTVNPKDFDVNEMASKTSDAYSAGCYTSWLACVKLLKKRGFDARETEAILRSKWTRWARDAWNGNGTPTSTALDNFLQRGKFGPGHPEVKELVDGTFD